MYKTSWGKNIKEFCVGWVRINSNIEDNSNASNPPILVLNLNLRLTQIWVKIQYPTMFDGSVVKERAN